MSLERPTESPEWGLPMPWALRWRYALRCLAGEVRVVGLVRVEQADGYMEGRIRWYFRNKDKENMG